MSHLYRAWQLTPKAVELNWLVCVWPQCPWYVGPKNQTGVDMSVHHLNSCHRPHHSLNESTFLIHWKAITSIRKQLKHMWVRGVTAVEDSTLCFSVSSILDQMQMSLREHNQKERERERERERETQPAKELYDGRVCTYSAVGPIQPRERRKSCHLWQRGWTWRTLS